MLTQEVLSWAGGAAVAHFILTFGRTTRMICHTEEMFRLFVLTQYNDTEIVDNRVL
jgi:hypothetical protein